MGDTCGEADALEERRRFALRGSAVGAGENPRERGVLERGQMRQEAELLEEKPTICVRKRASWSRVSTVRARSSTATWPEVGWSSLPMRLSSVDFAGPDGPTIATASFASTSRSTPRTASTVSGFSRSATSVSGHRRHRVEGVSSYGEGVVPRRGALARGVTRMRSRGRRDRRVRAFSSRRISPGTLLSSGPGL
jgi:hypothetical protein